MVMLQGKEYAVSQFQLKEFAAFQGYLETHYPHPLDSSRDELATLEGAERRGHLARLARLDLAYPPTFPCEESHWLFRTEQGKTFWLLVVLLKHQEVSAEEVGTLARTITEEEMRSVERVVYDLDPRSELYHMLHPDEGMGGDADWAEMIDAVARTHQGWTYEYIGDLTLSQFGVAMTGKGKQRPAGPSLDGLTQEELNALIRKQREKLRAVQARGGEPEPIAPASMTIPQVAKALGVSARKVRYHRDRGHLPMGRMVDDRACYGPEEVELVRAFFTTNG
jgi:hypothetical protein